MAKNADLSGNGESSPELVPVVETGALALALPGAAEASPAELALGDLLSDALFGEVIDISDLIPRVLSPAMDAPPPQSVADAAETGFFGQDAGDIAAAAGHGALTILYDDDIRALDGTIL